MTISQEGSLSVRSQLVQYQLALDQKDFVIKGLTQNLAHYQNRIQFFENQEPIQVVETDLHEVLSSYGDNSTEIVFDQ